MTIDSLIEKCLELLEGEKIDEIVFYFKKIGKRKVKFYRIMCPLLSFKVSSFIHKKRTLTVCIKKEKKKKKKKEKTKEKTKSKAWGFMG